MLQKEAIMILSSIIIMILSSIIINLNIILFALDFLDSEFVVQSQ